MLDDDEPLGVGRGRSSSRLRGERGREGWRRGLNRFLCEFKAGASQEGGVRVKGGAGGGGGGATAIDSDTHSSVGKQIIEPLSKGSFARSV